MSWVDQSVSKLCTSAPAAAAIPLLQLLNLDKAWRYFRSLNLRASGVLVRAGRLRKRSHELQAPVPLSFPLGKGVSCHLHRLSPCCSKCEARFGAAVVQTPAIFAVNTGTNLFCLRSLSRRRPPPPPRPFCCTHLFVVLSLLLSAWELLPGPTNPLALPLFVLTMS